jgi:hypothetical protein
MSDVHEEAKHATPSGLVNQHLISTIQARKIIPSPETDGFADISARPVSRAGSSQFNWENPRTCSYLHVHRMCIPTRDDIYVREVCQLLQAS